MATATEIARKALKRIGVLALDEQGTAGEVEDAKDSLNSMIAGFEGLWYQGDTLPLPERFEGGLVAMLAVRIAEDFNVTPGPVLLRDAKRGEEMLDAAFLSVPQSVFDASLVNVYSNSSWFGIQNPAMWYKVWTSNEEVSLRETRTLNGNLYEVVTAGTTGSTGPSGTGSAITDGTVTWCWRRVTG